MKKIKIIFVGIIALLVNHAFAVLEIEITKGASNAISIAILPFISETPALGSEIASIITNDLKNSGRFLPVNKAKLISANASNFVTWREHEVDATVQGKLQSISNKLKIDFELFDVYRQTSLIAKEYQVDPKQLRRLAHHLSDTIYQQLIGDRGVFSTKVAYVLVERQKNRHPTYKLQLADSDGYNPQTLVVSNLPLMSPSWSPDGKKISYVSFEGHRSAIYIQDLATGKRKILTKFPGINGAPAWSPDGTKMALVLTKTGYPKIYLLDLATGRLEQITDGWHLDTEPSWDPDGKSLIFTSNRGGGPQIYRIQLENKKIQRVTYAGNYNARGAFLPNGNAIVMLHREGEMFTIAAQDLRSNKLVLLSPSGNNESPSVAPNGKMILYATNKSGKGVLAAVSIDGKVHLVLPEINGEVREPAWSPFLK